jgi:hypothetical protein
MKARRSRNTRQVEKSLQQNKNIEKLRSESSAREQVRE